MRARLIYERGLGWEAWRWLLRWPGGALLSPSYGSEDACRSALEEALGR